MAVDIQFNADQALAKLGELVAKHGPQAVDLAAQVLHAGAVGQIAQGAALLVGAAGIMVGAFAVRKRGQRLRAAYREWSSADDAWHYARSPDRGAQPLRPIEDGDGYAPGAIAMWAFSALGFFLAASCMFDTWAWVALFNPKLALAHQVLAKFAGI